MALPDSSSNTTLYAHFPTYLVAQRASSVQATSLAVTSASFGATQAAMLLEVANTLIALGYWKGAA
jgi:hypothetical protein